MGALSLNCLQLGSLALGFHRVVRVHSRIQVIADVAMEHPGARIVRRATPAGVAGADRGGSSKEGGAEGCTWGGSTSTRLIVRFSTPPPQATDRLQVMLIRRRRRGKS